MGAQCAGKRHRLETEHEKLAAVLGGANTRVNWRADHPKPPGRGTGMRLLLALRVQPAPGCEPPGVLVFAYRLFAHGLWTNAPSWRIPPNVAWLFVSCACIPSACSHPPVTSPLRMFPPCLSLLSLALASQTYSCASKLAFGLWLTTISFLPHITSPLAPPLHRNWFSPCLPSLGFCRAHRSISPSRFLTSPQNHGSGTSPRQRLHGHV